MSVQAVPISATGVQGRVTRRSGGGVPRYLYGPWADFMLLGGSTLIIFPVLLLLPLDRVSAPLNALTWWLVNVLNHPHFAHSYQIFYRNFGAKAFGCELPEDLRNRYRFAGLVVPLLLSIGIGAAILRGDPHLLGYAGNLMALFVGWHYAKQGYGMLMVDAALKRHPFTARAKQALLVNAYAAWAFAWANANQLVKETNLWNLKYYAIGLPHELVQGLAVVAVLSSAATLLFLGRSWLSERQLPWAGVVAYAVSLYAWLMFGRVSPLWLMVFPALHSIQYLAVVWRYQANLEGAASRVPAGVAERASPRGLIMSLVRFGLLGLLLGVVGFWCAPLLLDAVVPYNHAIFGGTMFMFILWVFMNVHHFFLDNVIWRRENPDMRAHLFS